MPEAFAHARQTYLPTYPQGISYIWVPKQSHGMLVILLMLSTLHTLYRYSFLIAGTIGLPDSWFTYLTALLTSGLLHNLRGQRINSGRWTLTFCPGCAKACIRVLMVSTGYMTACSATPATAPANKCCTSMLEMLQAFNEHASEARISE